MNLSQIKLLHEYNAWADARIQVACANVTPEQYAAPNPFGTGRGGLRETMGHILDNIWQQRITLQGFYADPLADEAAYDATELRTRSICRSWPRSGSSGPSSGRRCAPTSTR